MDVVQQFIEKNQASMSQISFGGGKVLIWSRGIDASIPSLCFAFLLLFVEKS